MNKRGWPACFFALLALASFGATAVDVDSLFSDPTRTVTASKGGYTFTANVYDAEFKSPCLELVVAPINGEKQIQQLCEFPDINGDNINLKADDIQYVSYLEIIMTSELLSFDVNILRHNQEPEIVSCKVPLLTDHFDKVQCTPKTLSEI